MAKLTYRCIGKKRDSRGLVTEFWLQDKSGNRVIYTKKDLKSEIKSGKIDVINLKLTSDGKLIDDNSRMNNTKDDCKKDASDNESWYAWAEKLMDSMIRHISANLTDVMKPTTLNDGINGDSEDAMDRYFHADIYTLIDITIYRDDKTGVWVNLCDNDCNIIKEFQVAGRDKRESLIVKRLSRVEKYLKSYYETNK